MWGDTACPLKDIMITCVSLVCSVSVAENQLQKSQEKYHCAKLTTFNCYLLVSNLVLFHANRPNSTLQQGHVTWATGWPLKNKCLVKFSCLRVAWVRPGLPMTKISVVQTQSSALSRMTDRDWCPPLLDRRNSIISVPSAE